MEMKTYNKLNLHGKLYTCPDCGHDVFGPQIFEHFPVTGKTDVTCDVCWSRTDEWDKKEREAKKQLHDCEMQRNLNKQKHEVGRAS